MTMPPSASASASAAADLPLAVGPAISTASMITGKPCAMDDRKEIARFEALAEEAYAGLV